MDVGDTVASPGAPPDDVDEVMRRKVKDILLTVQRDIQVVFEREKETLGNARKTLGNARKMLDDKIRHIQEEMRKLEQSLRELATKERRLEANYHADMRKLDRWREDGVVDLQRSAPGVEPPSPVVEHSSVAAPPVPVAASIRRTRHETEDEQLQNARDMQRRPSNTPRRTRSNRPRRPAVQAQPGNTDTEPEVGSAEVSSSPSQRTSSPPRPPRSDDQLSLSITRGQEKRRRNAGDEGEEDGDADSQPQKRPRNDNPTVSYEEVYGNGRPQYRHAIVEYPKNSGKWFIIRCDKCGLHFGRNALQGGAKHLNGVKHGHLPREHVVTIRELGFRVLGCNKDKAKRNNDAFDRASRAGYAPHKRRTDQARWQSQESDEPGDEHPGQQRQTRRHPGVNAAALQTRHQRGKPFQGITDPIVGRLYRAWYRGGGFFVALMLPLGSFGSVGVVGKISNMLLGQQKKAPRCYDRSGERIIPWASGYEDGGPKFRERRFPMMYFEESAELSFKGGLVVPPSLGWVEAKHLRPFDVDDPECRLTKGFSNARAFLALTGRESDRGSEGLATNLWRGNSRAADQASQGTDDRGDNTQDDGTETEDEVQSSIRERRVSASASPPRSATPTTMNQDDEEDEDNGDEDEEDEDEEDEDDEGEDDEDEDDEDEDEGEDGEMVDGENAGGGGDNDRDKHGSGAPEDDQGTEDEAQDRVLSRPVPGAVYPLISAAQIQGESVAAAAEHEGYSHNSRREPNVPAPVDGEHRSGKPGPREVLTSQQGSAHETSNQDEQARQNGLMGTQNLVKATDQDPPHAAAQSGTPGKPVLDPSPPGVFRDTQILRDLHLAFEGLLAESRTDRLRTGGPADKDIPLRAAHRKPTNLSIPRTAHLPDADEDDPLGNLGDSLGTGRPTLPGIAQRALSLQMTLQPNEELEEPFSLSRTPGFSRGATQANKNPEEPTPAPPLPLPTSAPPLTNLYQLNQGGAPVHTTSGQIPTLPAIIQAQNRVQRTAQTQNVPTLSSIVGTDHRPSFHHHHYSLVQPLPATPGPLPAPTPSSTVPLLQRKDGHLSTSQFVYHFSGPIQIHGQGGVDANDLGRIDGPRLSEAFEV